MSHYDINPAEPENLPRPPGCGHWLTAFEKLGKECGTGIRLVWTPELIQFLWGKPRQRYAHWLRREHTGWFVGRFDAEGRFKPKRRVRWDAYLLTPEANHKLPNGDWLIPDWREWSVARPRWLIQERLPDHIERPAHEKNRYEWDEESCELVDALGPYPEEGKWATIQVIATHALVCCQKANAKHTFCWGATGRDPVDADIDEIRQRIQARDAEAKLRPDGLPTEMEWRKEYNSIMDEIAGNEQKNKQTYYEIFKEQLQPVFNMLGKKRVDLGSRHDEMRRLVLTDKP